MKLYPKKIRNIKELEKERKKLLKKSRELDKDEFPSLDGFLGGKAGGIGSGVLNTVTGFVSSSNPLTEIVLKGVMDRFSKKAPPPPPRQEPQPEQKKKGRSLPAKIAYEFVGGYLKWKAIELSYKGIKYLVNARRAKNN